MNLFAAIAIAAAGLAAGCLFRLRPKKWACPGGYEDDKGFHCGARLAGETSPPVKPQAVPNPQPSSAPPEPA